MSAPEPLYQLLPINPNNFSREEKIIIEAELFTRIYDEIKEVLKTVYKDYFRLLKFNTEMENTMLEADFMRCIINDILTTEEYSISGIACYTQTPEDIIYEIAMGLQHHPSITLSRKIIDLHRTVRPNLYREIIKKIAAEFMAAA